MEKKLYMWMLGTVVFIFALAMLFPHTPALVQLQDVNFDVKQNTALYFKNVRAPHYQLHEMRDAGFNMYRLDVDLALDTLPAFHFAIVHNWRADEAYILAEPNKLLGDTIALTIGNEPYTFVRNTLNNEAQYLFAVRIFEALKADVPLLFVDTGKPILGDKNLAKANKKALEDYFKLIYKLR